MEVLLDEAREAFDAEIVVELTSNTSDEMESNIERIEAWVKQWIKDNKSESWAGFSRYLYWGNAVGIYASQLVFLSHAFNFSSALKRWEILFLNSLSISAYLSESAKQFAVF